MRDGGVGDALVLELHRVRQSFALGVLDVARVRPIMQDNYSQAIGKRRSIRVTLV